MPALPSADREVLDRLIRIETKLDTAVHRSDDHEVRIRALEQTRWPLPALATLISLGALVIGLVNLVNSGGA